MATIILKLVMTSSLLLTAYGMIRYKQLHRYRALLNYMYRNQTPTPISDEEYTLLMKDIEGTQNGFYKAIWINAATCILTTLTFILCQQ